ncbi:hypothetical protein HanXRQr2_Chr14g0658771 [Helianthus annuus]|uniref:Uncharacterized protein n=1 Tax=Helianthus annuus TaxID=4232 RepID=A0A9K3EBB8_HELAN|nr:hypothetical protein HanXRQr2_Chr14g0658771 [Helianthus annuus]KAJ0841554.1 hypothetical protein HanPSC8_Chr14g0631701 [Helianthus annuus]
MPLVLCNQLDMVLDTPKMQLFVHETNQPSTYCPSTKLSSALLLCIFHFLILYQSTISNWFPYTLKL